MRQKPTCQPRARDALNKGYDAFTKANGPINADANKRLMRDDPTWPQLAALEDGFDKGVTLAVARDRRKAAPTERPQGNHLFQARAVPLPGTSQGQISQGRVGIFAVRARAR